MGEKLHFYQRSARGGETEGAALKRGASSLSNAELIAVLLGGGTAGSSAVNLAERILSMDAGGIRILNDCVPEELYRIDGVGPARAACLMAAAELGRRLHAEPKQKRINISSPGASHRFL